LNDSPYANLRCKSGSRDSHLTLHELYTPSTPSHRTPRSDQKTSACDPSEPTPPLRSSRLTPSGLASGHSPATTGHREPQHRHPRTGPLTIQRPYLPCRAGCIDGRISIYFWLRGGRTRWAHIELTRINIELTIHKNQFEDLREADASIQLRTHDPTKQPFSLVAQRLERIEVRCAPRR
jgi:hypothetical protein